MSADRLLDKLDGVKRAGPDRWVAKCPAHEDRRASLSIRELDDGRVLLHDFAGCGVEEILAAVGLDFDALFPERAVDHRVRPGRKPFRVGELVRALDHELHVTLILLAAIGAGKLLDPAERERAGAARGRIIKFIGELKHAA